MIFMSGMTGINVVDDDNNIIVVMTVRLFILGGM